MPDEQNDLQPPIGLTKEQKIGFVLLLIFGIIAVGFGVLQIRNTMYAPFALNSQVPTSLKNEVNGADALRFRDTDHDGLNDFDELYVYGTSPYLYDTFSYGMSDKEVVAKGLPLCPKGQDCAGLAVQSGAVPSVSVSGTLNSPAAREAAIGPPPPDLSKMLTDPAQIRQMLTDAGMAKEVLQKLSDADLMKLVRDSLNTSTSSSEGSLQDNLKKLNNVVNSKP
jgi:hypothetical protein